MDGWTEGRMDGWTDGRIDGWTDGWMDGWTDGRMDGWMDVASNFIFRAQRNQRKKVKHICVN